MLKKILILFLFLIPYAVYPAVNIKIDSLKQELTKDLQSQHRFQLLLELANEQIEKGDKDAVQTADYAYSIADSLNQDSDRVKALNLQGIAWKIWGDNQKSIVYLLKALDIVKKLNNQNDNAEVLMNIGETNRAAGNLEKSMEYLNKSLNLYLENKNQFGISQVYNRLAATSFEIFYNNNLGCGDIIKPLENKEFNFREIYNSNSFFRLKYDTVLYFADLSDKYSDNSKQPKINISNNVIVAAIYTLTYQYKEALEVYNGLLQDIQKSNAILEKPLTLYNLSVLNFKMKDYQKAIENANESYRLSNELDIKSYIFLSASFLSTIYETVGKYKEANEFMRIGFHGRFEYYQKNIDIKLKEMKYEFDIEMKQKEINNRNFQLIFLSSSFLLLLILISIFVVILIKKNSAKKILNQELKTKNLIITEQNNELAKINSEKDKFFSIIAHDLKSPFAGFLGITKAMSEEVQNFSVEEMQEMSKSMEDSAKNLYKLLGNLLEWSRIKRGITDFNPENCMLSFIVNQNVEIQAEVARMKAIEIINNIDDKLSVKVDVPMLNTIFRNLISNAVKFTPKGGRIELGTVKSNDASDISFNDSEVCIYVKDSGIGMSDKIVGKLFKLDEKSSRPGTEGESSTGLGLLLCKEFVEKNNGRIWVKSEEEKGSTFYFTVPKAE